MTATVRPVDSVQALPLLGQNLRRHYEHILLFTDQMFVHVPGIGRVLVTEDFGKFRLDIIGPDEQSMKLTIPALEADVRAQVAGQRLLFTWEKSAFVPVPFRN